MPFNVTRAAFSNASPNSTNLIILFSAACFKPVLSPRKATARWRIPSIRDRVRRDRRAMAHPVDSSCAAQKRNPGVQSDSPGGFQIHAHLQVGQ